MCIRDRDIKHIPDVVKLTGASFHIIEEECEGVLQHLIEGGSMTLYGLANAVTRFSQDVESYDPVSYTHLVFVVAMLSPPESQKPQ